MNTPVKHLTLVVPTYNRPRRLRRLLEYYREANWNHQIVVVDSSANGGATENARTVEELGNDLELRYETVATEWVGLRKLVYGVSIIRTPYVVFCADDDILVPTSVELCCSFLRDNSDFAAAMGKNVFFSVTTNSDDGEWSFKILWAQSPPSLEVSSPTARLSQHLADYRPTFYAVHRRQQVLENFEKTHRQNVPGRFGELLPSCLTVLQGKIKRFDVPYALREFHEGQASATDEDWDALILGSELASRYAQFRGCLVEQLVTIGETDEFRANEAVDRATLAFLAERLSPHRKPGPEPDSPNDTSKSTRMLSARRCLRRLPGFSAVNRLRREIMYRKTKRGTTHDVLPAEISDIAQHVLRHADSVHDGEYSAT